MVNVELSCSPLNTLVSEWSFTYPFANTPPRDLCATSRAAGPDIPTRILLLGCSDLVSVAHTLHLNRSIQIFGSDVGWKSTPLHAICCDIEPSAVARMLIFLQLVAIEGRVDDESETLSLEDVVVAWEVVYNVFLTRETAAKLRKGLEHLCEEVAAFVTNNDAADDDAILLWKSSPLGRLGVHLTGNTAQVLEILEWWCDVLQKNEAEWHGLDNVTRVKQLRKKARDACVRGGNIVDAHGNRKETISISITGSPDLFRGPVESYFEKGFVPVSDICNANHHYLTTRVASLSSTITSQRVVVNPTFFAESLNLRESLQETLHRNDCSVADLMRVWRVHYNAHPFHSMPDDLFGVLAELPPSTRMRFVRSLRQGPMNIVESCFEAFGKRCEALAVSLRSGLHKIGLHCGDAFALCDALRPIPRAWLPSQMEEVADLAAVFESLNMPRQFDCIDTSNIGDYTSVLPLLLSASPLLASVRDNPRATLATDLMKASGDSAASIIQGFLKPVPLWLIPFVCGVHISHMKSDGKHRDSRSMQDTSWAWTAYSRTVGSSMTSSGAGAFPVRWERCFEGFEPTRLRDSNEMKTAIYGMMEHCMRFTQDSFVGMPTFVRFMDSMVKSGALTNVYEDIQDLFLFAGVEENICTDLIFHGYASCKIHVLVAVCARSSRQQLSQLLQRRHIV